MIKVSARTAHHAFSKYLDLAHEGQQIVITKRGQPWATLKPAATTKRNSRKIIWPDVLERTRKLFKGRKVDAVKTLLAMREEERW
jgi:prevent-host-death family protein